MKKLAITCLFVLCTSPSWALDIGGIQIPGSFDTQAQPALALNGAGIREKWFMDLYVGALYLKSNNADAEAILSSQDAMAIRLHIISGMITSEKMTKATVEGFENATQGNTQPLEKEITLFLDTFKQPIKEGDVFDFVFEPNSGIKIYKNQTLAQTINSGIEFKKALFGIWLSKKPAQKSLKNDMLGKQS